MVVVDELQRPSTRMVVQLWLLKFIMDHLQPLLKTVKTQLSCENYELFL